ncbi:MAG: pantoate--beta-alanine ligase [Anaerolineae bacterium CG_4_9_14_3_um_filter_57_17]|nr:pantoate--beta-alanine ligase [bacterium]NCT22168.1 pantoate--beta-alanine ligase [bacterium]OIO85611.1 MAG: pantoate--beta-alanine ligase [Anaerolineae bacterium CG2_30_57_67]PJB67075.1 MAG: pantoate--beta-alanine ligase [Anaerolineae bacterium CG_4_9_14_3_um_filter_57_17]
MILATTLEELRAARGLLGAPLGLVPTMGYLHAGHISLVERARAECASVAVSIFVNPTQFGPKEDLASYPRNLPGDLKLLEDAGVNLVWMPTAEIMYPPDFQTWVNVEGLTSPLEGAMRPGHFRGVTTVVAKLFNAIQPQKAYFGQKDAQQAAVIRRMTHDLNFPIEIVVCPIKREADGLAMSSRNAYLNPAERQAATVLFCALNAAQAAYAAGERNADSLRQAMSDTINAEPLARLQYISCADNDSLEELKTVTGKTLLSMAVYLGKTRLIDNFILGE